MKSVLGLSVGVLIVTWATSATGDDAPARYQKRWFYLATNMLVEKNCDEAIALMERAQKAGYNGVVLTDSKLQYLDRMFEPYFKNIKRVKAAADRLGIEIIPGVFPIGYSNNMLSHDPNLAEGVPVKNTPFVVKERELVPALEPKVEYPNGGLEDLRGDGQTFAKLGFQDEPGRVTFPDHEVVHGGKTSCRMTDDGKTPNRRLNVTIKVRPFTCYRFSAWIKTEKLQRPGSFNMLALAKDRSLTFSEGGIEPTQDWKRRDAVFNSLENDSVGLYIGIWGPSQGTLWVDDITLEELGPINALRRPGCPFTITSSDGKTKYVEERDFETFADPKLGQVPWAGEYEWAHDVPTIQLAKSSRLLAGQRVLVSWYHPIITVGGQVMCCPSEPRTYELLREEAKSILDLLHPKTVLMNHDEIRVLNWCQACQSRKLSPGGIIADNTKKCYEILKELDPKIEILDWSDMFDPTHNAHDNYYLVNGTLAGSWEGLPKEVVVVNWNSGKARESLGFFAKRGHRQIIAGYYDVDDLSGFTSWDAATRGMRGVDGFIYTTWEHKFGLLATYGKAMREANP